MIWGILIVMAIAGIYFYSNSSKPQEKKTSLPKTQAKKAKYISKKKPNKYISPKRKIETPIAETPQAPPSPQLENDFDSLPHPDIKAFAKLIVENNKKVTLSIQNEWVKFYTEPALFKTTYNNTDLKEDCKKISTNTLIDPDSARILFNSDHVDGEGPNLITDKSGKIFKFHFGFGEPTAELRYDSIWEVFDGKENFITQLKTNDPVPHFENIARLADYTNEEEIIKFQIDGFFIDSYKAQLEELFAKSNGSLRLDNFTWEKFIWEGTDLINCSIEINGIQKDIQIEKSKWYSVKFPGTINQILAEMNHPLRISMVHEYQWDEIHGVKLSSIEEYELLKKKNFIVA